MVNKKRIILEYLIEKLSDELENNAYAFQSMHARRDKPDEYEYNYRELYFNLLKTNSSEMYDFMFALSDIHELFDEVCPDEQAPSKLEESK